MTISQPNPSIRPTGMEPAEFIDGDPLLPDDAEPVDAPISLEDAFPREDALTEDDTEERVDAMPEHPTVAAATEAAEDSGPRQGVPVNMYETPDALVVVAPLPAVQPEDVVIEVRPGTLRVEATVRSAGPRDYLVHEWSYGGYEREVSIPDEFGSGVSASLGNGQLAVRIQRGDARTIRIRPRSR